MEPMLEQDAPHVKTTRRRRTDQERVAELQEQLVRLTAASEAKKRKAAAKAVAARPVPSRKRRSINVVTTDSEIDNELRDLVESFVASLREVIRKALIAEATRALAANGVASSKSPRKGA